MSNNSVWNFEIAKAAISEGEKDRILCLFFNGELTNVDWDKATKDFGSASVNSMKVSLNNMYKKIEKAGGKEGDRAAAVGTPVKATPRKRKAQGAEGEESSAGPKKRGRTLKKAVEASTDHDDTEKETKVKVKEEGAGFEDEI